MRLQLILNTTKQQISLPIAYQHLVQGFVYSLLEPVFRRFLHEKAYNYEKRNFKLFTFSRLKGQYKVQGALIKFIPPVGLVIASAKQEILQELANGMFRGEVFYLGKNNLMIETVSVLPQPEFNLKDKVIAQMLSPWTMYSTVENDKGIKQRKYYSPSDDESVELLRDNLKKKYQIVYGKPFDDNAELFNITPYKVNPKNRQVVMFQKSVNGKDITTPITAWNGLYELTGSPAMLELAYNTGIGSNNSMGFGCWEVYTND